MWVHRQNNAVPLSYPPRLLQNPAFGFGDRGNVDAGDSPTHEPGVVELPKFVAVGSIPLTAGVVPFIFEGHGYAVVSEGLKCLLQAVFEFLLPLALQEGLDCLPPLQEFRAIAPFRIR